MTLAETQAANRRLQDMPRARRNARNSASAPKSCRPTSSTCPWRVSRRGATGPSPAANEFAQGVLEAAQEKAEAAMQRVRGETPRKPKRNRGHLPPHLPRVERVIEPASTLCPCGCGEMVRIGEDVSERLDPPRGNSPPDCFLILVDPRPVPGAGHAAPEICLPPLLASCRAGPCPRACRARRPAHGTLHRLDYRLEVR